MAEYRQPALAIAAIILGLLICAYSVIPSRAHDMARPELDGWFNQLKNKSGFPCCSHNDGKALEDVDWEATKDGHYRVYLEGEWIVVPDTSVITEPNKAGKTMVWQLKGHLGTSIVCFMPGSMT